MADRYWVGGTASWDATAGTKWATTSGGAGGAAVPTSVDDVYFNAASGAVTITVGAVGNCRSWNMTGFTGTLAGTFNVNVYGSLTMGSGMTRTWTGGFNFLSTSTGNTLTFNGKTTDATTVFNGVGGGWTVQDTWTNSTSKPITLTAGTLNTNGQTITSSTFTISGSTTRTLTLGASTINTTAWIATTTTGLTFNVGTSTINLTQPSASSVIFAGGGLTYNIVTCNATANGLLQIQDANTFGTLTINGLANTSQEYNFTANQTITGTLTIAGNNVSPNRLFIYASGVGTPRTISAATTSLSNVDFQDIIATGGGAWSGTSIGNSGGCTGITFTTPVTRYGVAAGNWSSTASWSASNGGAPGASAPICHDTVILNSNSGAGTYTVDNVRLGTSLDCTGFTGTLTTVNMQLTGSLTFSTGMTHTSSTGYLRLWGRSGSYSLVTGGKTFSSKSININGFGTASTYTQNGNLVTGTTSGSITLISGTYDSAGFTVDFPSFSSATTTDNVRTLNMGASTWIMGGTGSITVWNAGTTNNSNLTINAGTSTIECQIPDAATKYFVGGGKSYNIVLMSGAGASAFTIDGSNTFQTFQSTRSVAHSLLFTTGTNQSIRNWSISGTAGQVVTINSTTTGTHTLTKIGGGVVSADYLNIQHSLARPGAWYAGLNSVNNQGVATAGNGWQFTTPPIPNKKTSTNFAPRRAHNY